MNSIEREIINRKHDKKRNKEGAAIFGNVMGYLVVVAGIVGIMKLFI